ncbi:MAG: hypothetical protein Ta2B_29910 [Termitinemataceae bacterium]|nr:MAG: hypothetical protein Ta2B_29910 [Termitinemataceae bacterium]
MTEVFFTVAVIGQPFALDGFLKLRSLSGESEHLLKLSNLSVDLCMPQRSGSAKCSETRTVKVECIKESGANLLIKFKNIDTFDDAKKLAGMELLVKRENGAKLRQNEFYIKDLKGLCVVDGQKNALGKISDVVEGGNGSLIEIELLNGEKKFAPFRKEFFGEISIKRQEAQLIAPWVLE